MSINFDSRSLSLFGLEPVTNIIITMTQTVQSISSLRSTKPPCLFLYLMEAKYPIYVFLWFENSKVIKINTDFPMKTAPKIKACHHKSFRTSYMEHFSQTVSMTHILCIYKTFFKSIIE